MEAGIIENEGLARDRIRLERSRWYARNSTSEGNECTRISIVIINQECSPSHCPRCIFVNYCICLGFSVYVLA